MTVKSRILELLERHRGETLSGEALAGELCCTRAAVWKAVKALREEGYLIEAGPNKGYMLSRDTDRLSREGLRLYLKHPEADIRIFDEVDSTNQAAKQLAVTGEPVHGSFVLARRQSAGRGRRGRSFFSPRDGGIYLSVILRPDKTVRESLLLTTAAATAVYKAVRSVCGIELDIKWVNDLYYHGKKVCGILTEAVTDFESGNIELVIVGIGLNLRQSEEEMSPELSEVAGVLFEEEHPQVQQNRLVAELVNTLLEETENLKLSEEYVKRNMIPGNRIVITDGGKKREAAALCICEDGRLLVEESDGSRTLLSYGEVSVMPATGKKTD